MVEVAKITLWGQPMGALSWDRRRNFASFEYFPGFLNSGWNVAPLHMPLSDGRGRIYSFPGLNENTYRGLPGLLSDVLPDDFGNKLIDNWLEISGIARTEFTPLDRLCYIGKRGMGALEFEPGIHSYKPEATPLDVEGLIRLAQKVVNEREQLKLNLTEASGLNELIKVGTSAGGQRAKAVIAYNKNTREIRSGQTKVPKGFEHYIFKFDGITDHLLADPAGYGRIEYAYYLMALDCDIEMNESLLFEENGRAHFMTKRFDRVGENEKLHMQTLCALAHFDYRAPGVYSYENAFEVMRMLRLSHLDATQLYRRMVFNIIARNQDDHTKNISFLMDKEGKWKLSPAYDMTFAFNPTGAWTSMHQMSVNGKRDNFTMKDLITVGEHISLKNSRQIIREISSVVSGWEDYAKKAGIEEKQINAIKGLFLFI